MYICVAHLSGRCGGPACSDVHTSGATYQWQVSSDGGTKWNPCASQLEVSLEKQFCDVTITKPTVTFNGKTTTVDFHKMVLSSGERLRRLSTQSSVCSNATKYHTVWKWYWLNNYSKWLAYETQEEFDQSSVTNQEIEAAYMTNTEGKATFNNTKFQYELDFSKMEQRNLETNKARPVIRRPAAYRAPPKPPAITPTSAQQSLCVSHVSGSCTNSCCPNLHPNTQMKKPYQWYLQQGGVTWSMFDDGTNVTLEINYSDPNSGPTTITCNSASPIQVDFDGGRLSSGETISRHCTPSAAALPNPTVHHTTWLWYWQTNNTTWMCYGEEEEWGCATVDSAEIEAEYTKNPQGTLQFRNNTYPYTLSFATMTQKNEETGKVRKVIRRPKTYQADMPEYNKTLCTQFLCGQCSGGAACRLVHSNQPYQWMILRSRGARQWQALDSSDNQQLERNYCDVNKQSHVILINKRHITVDFDTMLTSDGDRIARTSTPSSLATSSPYATTWQWYWLDENNTWTCYGQAAKHGASSTTSDDIEKLFLNAKSKKQLNFKNNDYNYTLDLTTMTQTNTSTRKIRRVRRRPVSFVSNIGGGATSASSSFLSSKSVCVKFLEGTCTQGPTCSSLHCLQPYQWCYRRDKRSEWNIYVREVNEQLEHYYCDPSVLQAHITMPNGRCEKVDFNRMTIKDGSSQPLHIKRCCTISSIRAPLGVTTQHYTEWLWYWCDNNDIWTPYGQKASHGASSISHADIEKAYVKNPSSKLQFSSQQHKYTLDLARWTQTNDATSVQRAVRRRPKLNTTIHYPFSWGCSGFYAGYELVQLDSHKNKQEQQEYQKIEGLFSKTASNSVMKIERVQNPLLWEAFCRRKKQILVTSGKSDVEERLLFHGTQAENLPAILEQGFDWRYAGTSWGTSYGRGSYFARDASYSAQYTNNSQMLVSQVLVGTYTVGNSSMVKPPALDTANKPKGPFYDSTVDNSNNPSVFVVYHCDQAYPAYLITYK